MTRFLPLILVAWLGVASVHADESWIEGRWIASRDHTIDELTHGDLEAKSKLGEVMGEIDAIWTVDSGRIQITRAGNSMEWANYFIRPIREGVFEMIFDLESGDQQRAIIHRRGFGFCYQYGGDYSNEPSPDTQECYVRDDA